MAPISLALGAAVTLLLASCPAVAEEAPERTGEAFRRAAREALRRGDGLRTDGRCESAIAAWRAGMTEVPHWAFLLRIGDCYGRLGRNDRALAYLRRGLERAGGELDPHGRAEVEAAIERILAELPPLLEVASPVGGVEVRIDGAAAGTTPGEIAVAVAAGDRVVRGRRAGLADMEARVRVRAGERVIVVLEPHGEREVAVEGERPAELSASDRRPVRRSWWAVALVLAGAGLAGGGGYLASLDGSEDRSVAVVLDTLGPGVALVGLGAGLVAGGIALIAAPPSATPR